MFIEDSNFLDSQNLNHNVYWCFYESFV